MLFGSIVLALGKSIPQHMERMLEFAVGVMLIALGADVLRRLYVAPADPFSRPCP